MTERQRKETRGRKKLRKERKACEMKERGKGGGKGNRKSKGIRDEEKTKQQRK